MSGDYVEKVSENFGRMIRDNSRQFAGHVPENVPQGTHQIPLSGQNYNIYMTTTIWADNVELQACEVEINGQKQWRWIATNFEGNTMQDGDQANVYTYADSFKGLFY